MSTVTITLTLADGTVVTQTLPRLPQAWKSYLMQRAPCGTDYAGAVWSRTRGA